MAGTRLAVHATFVAELLLLVTLSFLYASTRPHDPAAAAEPFLPDRSGWAILKEDVSLVPALGGEGGIVAQMGEIAESVVRHVSALMGVEAERRLPERPRRASAFVEELRQKVGDEKRAPILRVNLIVPQIATSTVAEPLVDALARGLEGRLLTGHSPRVIVKLAESAIEPSGGDLCEDAYFSAQSKLSSGGNRREVKIPQVFLLMGCSRATVSEGQLWSMEVDRDSGTVFVRTVLAPDQMKELERDLEKEIASTLFRVFHAPLPAADERVSSVSIALMDEDPKSRVSEAGGIDAKGQFDALGQALSLASQSAMGPILKDLSFLYGGEIEDDGASAATRGSVIDTVDTISLEVTSSAYRSLPIDPVEHDSADNETVHEGSLISSEELANWAHMHPRQRNAPGAVEWTIAVPSQQKAPVKVYEESTGGEGESIILSSAPSVGNSIHPDGVSILNLPCSGGDVDMDAVYQMQLEKMQESLANVMGYIRALHGLPPSADLSSSNPSVAFRGEKSSALSFWELESIARSQYRPTLERVFSETDALLALLHQHGGSLQFPAEVAHTLNNATHLLRQSMSLAEEGFPAMYATSLLHGALRYLESVQSDHRFVELPYFAPDHYLAVFSPLVLPLFLPMIVGLIREIKRYRELRNKKKSSDDCVRFSQSVLFSV